MDGSDGIVLTLNNLLAMLMINNLSINHSQDFNWSKMYLPTIKDGPKNLITQIRAYSLAYQIFQNQIQDTGLRKCI